MTAGELLDRLDRVGGDVVLIASPDLSGEIGRITLRGTRTDLRWSATEPHYLRVESHAEGAQQIAIPVRHVDTAIREFLHAEGRTRGVAS